MNKHQELSRAAALLGKKGGQKGGLARVKKGFAMGDPSAAGKKGMLARWGDKLRKEEASERTATARTDNKRAASASNRRAFLDIRGDRRKVESKRAERA